MTTTLSQTLRNKARYWAGEVTKLAKSFAPAHVEPSISSHVDEKGDGTFLIRTIADTKKVKDARAQEFGSGLHARRGPKAKYPIYPKNKKVLAFFWEVATSNPDQFVMTPDGKVLLPKVMHPGIKPVNGGHGYIRPAQIKIRKRIRKDLNRDVPNAIRAELRLGFKK